MSLINQMLQELDARRSDAVGATAHGAQVRAVPERSGFHPAWWLALALAIVLAGVLAWLLLRPSIPVNAEQARPSWLPLKLDTGLAATSPVPATADAREQIPATKLAEPVLEVAPAVDTVSTAGATVEAVKEDMPAQPASASASIVPMPALAKLAPAAATPKPQPAAIRSESQPVTVHKQVKELTPQQHADNEYRNAILLLQQGKNTESIGSLEHVLHLDPLHAGAREALIGLLLDTKRNDDAARIAREGLDLDVHQAGLAMILARLQLEKGALHAAIETLQHSLPYAADKADYQAFLAALLQRDARHKEAVTHYLRALGIAPRNGVWWMGLGISLQADHRLPEAREAFKRARETDTLSAELLAFVNDRLGQLPH